MGAASIGKAPVHDKVRPEPSRLYGTLIATMKWHRGWPPPSDRCARAPTSCRQQKQAKTRSHNNLGSDRGDFCVPAEGI
eukprot:5154757-Amphidinium_carterae.1